MDDRNPNDRRDDTRLDLVNTADFSLVSIQPYDLSYRRSHSIEQSAILTTNTTIMNIQENPVSRDDPRNYIDEISI